MFMVRLFNGYVESERLLSGDDWLEALLASGKRREEKFQANIFSRETGRRPIERFY